MRRLAINAFCTVFISYVIFLSGCQTLFVREKPFAELQDLSLKIKQAIVVNSAQSGSFQAQLTGWERQNDHWELVWKDIKVVLGRNGLSPKGEKREGDGKTPSGTYPLGTAFGYAPSIDTKLNYRQATENDFWVDDPSSAQYNQWVAGQPLAKSFERMKREDHLYQYGVVIEYNTSPVIPGDGSAIFIHVWRKEHVPTSGCVAVSEHDILRLLKWLDQSQSPVIILGHQD